MDGLIQRGSGILGVPPDLLRIAVCMLASFPLGSLVKRIPSKNGVVKDLVVFALGVFYLAGMFNLVRGAFYLLFLSSITYTLAWAFPNKRWMPWGNFIVQMGMMFITHCSEQLSGGDYINQIGISGSQMIVLQKLTSFAWDIYDGSQPLDSLTVHQKETRISQFPSVLRFLAYIFFFPTIMTGPACTYMEYSTWSDGSMFKELDLKGSQMPRSGALILSLKLVEGLLWVGLYTQSAGINFEFLQTDWYKTTPFWGRVGYLYIVGLMFRTKYYAAWLITEAVCINIGLSFNGANSTTKKLRWDRMQNVKPLSVETAQNIHDVFANWNIITAKWLRFYVYERVTPKGQKPGTKSTFITFLVSALWHGTRPGYYLTFVTGAIYQTFGKLFRRNVRPIFLDTPYRKVYNVITWIVTQLALSYAVVPFIVLNLTPAFRCWSSVNFYIFQGLLVSWLALAGPGRAIVLPRLRKLHRDIKRVE